MNELLNFIISYFNSLINILAIIYISRKILNKKPEKLKVIDFLVIILLVLYITITHNLITSSVRIFVNFVLFGFLIQYLYKDGILKSLFASLIIMVITIISEIFYAIIAVNVFEVNIEYIKNNLFGDCISNIVITIIMIILINQKLFLKTNRNIISKLNIETSKTEITFIFVTIFILSLMFHFVYFQASAELRLILILGPLILYFAIVLGLFKEKNEKDELKLKNNLISESLNEYENMYSHQRMKNHEFKNELSIIRGMISKNNKKAIAYMDELIELRDENTKDFMEILKRIPDGGLRGILYYKLSLANDNNINIDFTTGKNFKVKNYTDLPEKTKLNICKLLGIYLDNAMQATKETKDKYLYIHISVSNEELTFRIANTFIGNINTQKIYNKGYSTKKNGRGHGLSIAKRIIESDNCITNITSINSDKFVQEIKIKM